MKYIDTSVITLTAGYPPSKKGLDFLQSEAKEAIAMLVNQLIGSTYVADTPYSIYGCEKTDLGGDDYAYTEGVIFYNGELYDFPAVALVEILLTDICTITPTADATADPTELTDGSSVNMHFNRALVVSDAAAITNSPTQFNFSDIINPNDWGTYNGVNGDMAADTGTWTLSTGSVVVSYIKRNGMVTLSFNASGTDISAASISHFLFTLPAAIGTPSVECFGAGKFVNTTNPSYLSASANGTNGCFVRAKTDGDLHINSMNYAGFYGVGGTNDNIDLKFSITFPVD